MRLTLTLKLDGAAFSDGGAEVARILGKEAYAWQDREVDREGCWDLRDTYGNTCGSVLVEAD